MISFEMTSTFLPRATRACPPSLILFSLIWRGYASYEIEPLVPDHLRLALRGFAGEPLRAPELVALPLHSTTTVEQRQRIVAVTRALEAAPFGEAATLDQECGRSARRPFAGHFPCDSRLVIW